jgi:hypothetical protein
MNVNRVKAVTRSRRGIPERTIRIGLIALAGLGCTALPLRSDAVNPVHPNPTAEQDEATVVNRGDVVNLPAPLKKALGELAEESHTYLPLQVFAEADKPSQLAQSASRWSQSPACRPIPTILGRSSTSSRISRGSLSLTTNPAGTKAG